MSLQVDEHAMHDKRHETDRIARRELASQHGRLVSELNEMRTSPTDHIKRVGEKLLPASH